MKLMPTGFAQVLPIQFLLRKTWNRKLYLTGSCNDPNTGKPKPFLVEESSTVTLEKITQLMCDDSAWASIAMIAHITSEAELVGNWAERCGCPEHQDSSSQTLCVSEKPRRRSAKAVGRTGSSNCCFRGCRAPELAAGRALTLQSTTMRSSDAEVIAYISLAPEHKRSELHGSWSKARGKLWGNLSVLLSASVRMLTHTLTTGT